MPSEKTPVVEYIYDSNIDPSTGKLKKTIVTLSEVGDAIRHFVTNRGVKLSDRNPANFVKDLVRGQNASKNWPDKLKALRITAVQRTGGGDAFEFVPYHAGQTEPFPDTYKPSPGLPEHRVQSVSMALEAKELGRQDEPWLIQTAVNLRIVETHFAVESALDVQQITHLQMSVKLRANEIDALFMAVHKLPGGKASERFVITCEAKQARERILEHQILGQANAALDEVQDTSFVVPIGLRAIRGKGFYLVEFMPILRATPQATRSLVVASEAVYQLVPPVKGV
jgi:hypothetical protein